uniref:Phosphoglycerate mutase-like protein n=1 Tax=Dunaliella tertiolecta TaxID=3047 RepID=A0A7S3QYR3_DUNTE|mmetsp:Transcript_17998/g.50293  ORF Transcript_17998/g.50293 Transcript_17998/m.50293 type:complete len:472 (+) Transcript_17998:295-1710(+)
MNCTPGGGGGVKRACTSTLQAPNTKIQHRRERRAPSKHNRCTPMEASTNGGAGSPAVNLEEQVKELRSQVLKQQELLEKMQHQLSQQQQQQQQTSEPPKTSTGWSPDVSPFEAQRIGIGDRRLAGLYDARFHSTATGAIPRDFRVLPDKIFLVRHAESEGNVNSATYSFTPDSQVSLTERGRQQAREAGLKIKACLEAEGCSKERLFFYTSPYRRSLETYEHIAAAFPPESIIGVQEEVQLREQDFGNFQDAEGKKREKADRLRFGRFYYRFPDGESGADVYDRLTIFEDHLIRDINAGRFANGTTLVLVSHGLAIRILLMRWFHWTVNQFMCVYNPPNSEPVVLERVPDNNAGMDGAATWMHTKALYRLSESSLKFLPGCTLDMCSSDHMPRPLPLKPLPTPTSPPESPRHEYDSESQLIQQQQPQDQPPRQQQEPSPEWEAACPMPSPKVDTQSKKQAEAPPLQFQEPA